jgi:hypothetical protein
MTVTPIFEEARGSAGSAMIAELAGLSGRPLDEARVEALKDRRPPRRLAVYSASAGFDLVDELDHLAARTVEPNIFFNPRFLAPAMPRLEDREVRLAIIRDGDGPRSRLRLLVPFSIERSPVPLGTAIMRSWSSPFGPLGTPLVDRDDPVGVIEDFLEMLARPRLGLPRVLVLPDMRLDGPVAGIIRTAALARGLPIVTTNRLERPFLQSGTDPEDYLRRSLSAHHFREFRRLKRRLADQGALEHRVLRQPDEIRHGVETFLSLEVAGWKGRERTAMAVDRFRAAFAREAVYGLAEKDLCRIHLLELDGRPIACLIVFVEAGIAHTWKTAYDEAFQSYSPGTLLMIEATRMHLDDPNIDATDSCAVPDHPVMSRLWTERRTMATLMIGVTPDADRQVRQAATQLHLYRETRNMARILRNRIRGLVARR